MNCAETGYYQYADICSSSNNSVMNFISLHSSAWSLHTQSQEAQDELDKPEQTLVYSASLQSLLEIQPIKF